MTVYIKKLHKDAVIPKQATLYAGGWDITATEVIQVEPDLVICKLGFALQLPAGYRLMVQSRSSVVKTRWFIQNSPGLGDPDYFGEYTAHFRALPVTHHYGGMGNSKLLYEKFPYRAGDRIGQCYLERIVELDFHQVDELNIIGDRTPQGHAGTTGK